MPTPHKVSASLAVVVLVASLGLALPGAAVAGDGERTPASGHAGSTTRKAGSPLPGGHPGAFAALRPLPVADTLQLLLGEQSQPSLRGGSLEPVVSVIPSDPAVEAWSTTPVPRRDEAGPAAERDDPVRSHPTRAARSGQEAQHPSSHPVGSAAVEPHESGHHHSVASHEQHAAKPDEPKKQHAAKPHQPKKHQPAKPKKHHAPQPHKHPAPKPHKPKKHHAVKPHKPTKHHLVKPHHPKKPHHRDA